MDKATLENTIRGPIATGLRVRGFNVQVETRDAVVDGTPDSAGKLPENPNTGAGQEGGNTVLIVLAKPFVSEFPESYFASIFAAGGNNEACILGVIAEAPKRQRDPLAPVAPPAPVHTPLNGVASMEMVTPPPITTDADPDVETEVAAPADTIIGVDTAEPGTEFSVDANGAPVETGQ